MGRRRWVAPCRGQLNILSHRSNGGIHISARPLLLAISLRNIIIFAVRIRGNGKFSTRIFFRTVLRSFFFFFFFGVDRVIDVAQPRTVPSGNN